MNATSTNPIRRRDDGSIDTAYYVDRAGALRWGAMRCLVAHLLAVVWRRIAADAVAAGPATPVR